MFPLISLQNFLTSPYVSLTLSLSSCPPLPSPFPHHSSSLSARLLSPHSEHTISHRLPHMLSLSFEYCTTVCTYRLILHIAARPHRYSPFVVVRGLCWLPRYTVAFGFIKEVDVRYPGQFFRSRIHHYSTPGKISLYRLLSPSLDHSLKGYEVFFTRGIAVVNSVPDFQDYPPMLSILSPYYGSHQTWHSQIGYDVYSILIN